MGSLIESAEPHTERHRLLQLEREQVIDQEFVAREAGDLPLTDEQFRLHTRVRRTRGAKFHSDLLFVLTHTRYSDERARTLWLDILAHEQQLELTLGRSVGVAVACLDYLTNVAEQIDTPVIVPEERLSAATSLATRDALTGLYDPSAFRTIAKQELSRARRYERALSVLMIDVDHFKRVNDERGHVEGDALLRSLATLLNERSRACDSACRYGGDELALVVPELAADGAARLAERLRQEARESCADAGVSLSIGVASYPEHGRTVDALVRSADHALYASKRAGRDRVTVAGAGPRLVSEAGY